MLPAKLPDHPALRSGLITLIGNKRRLLPMIFAGLQFCEQRIGELSTFGDAFAGSAVVSRLARLCGLRVHANDIEDFARPGMRVAAELTAEQADRLCSRWGGYRRLLDHLNDLTEPATDDRWCARHYAPADTERPDLERERLFYTRENALRIDAILAFIDEHLNDGAQESLLTRDLVLASLLVEMSVHSNTSGVMKGFHRGWGGRGGDALSRILAPVELEAMPWIEGPVGSVSLGDAAEISRCGRSFDVVYADPPYNIHQYGANYHLLTSAVRGDRYNPGPVVRGARAGIRTDHTRSDYSRRSGTAARDAFADFVEAIDTRALLVSYSADGIIEPRTMAEILIGDGRHTVELLTAEHSRYKGGKATQAGLRTTEFLFVVQRDAPMARTARESLAERIRLLEHQRSLHDSFVLPQRWRRAGGGAQRAGDGGWLLYAQAGDEPSAEPVLTLRSDLRVARVSEAGFDDTLSNQARSQKIDEAVAALIDEGCYREAIELLGRLKIRRYRREFRALAERLERIGLAARERDALARLVARVDLE